MMATGVPGKLALAPDYETASLALVERLPGGEIEFELKHVATDRAPRARQRTLWNRYLTGKSRSITCCRR